MLATNINLKDKIPGSNHFTWREALFLHSWDFYAIPQKQAIINNIIDLAARADKVRAILKVPMIITNWWRPIEYNKFIGGAKASHHVEGGALDFCCGRLSSEEVRLTLITHLDDLGLRMENLPDANWVHIDNKLTQGNRFFIP